MTGAVFRVQPDGLWDELWTAKTTRRTTSPSKPDGAVLVATGAKGKLFRLSGDPVSAVLVTRVPAQQATMIARAADRTFIATANPGLLMSIVVGARRARHVRIRRQGRAAGVDVGRRGLARHRARRHEGRGLHALGQHPDAGRGVERMERAVRQRRGLADHQPEGALSAVARGADRHGGAAPVLTSLSSAYLPRNIRPQVASITVHPPGVVFQKPFSSGETEIAGLDEDAQDKRARGEQPPAAARRRSAGACSSAGCRRSRGRPTTTTATS